MRTRNTWLTISLTCTAACAAEVHQPELFANASATFENEDLPHSRRVSINTHALDRLQALATRETTDLTEGSVLIDLFDEAQLSFTPSDLTRGARDALVLTGSLNDDPLSSAILRVERNRLHGTFHYRGRGFELKPDGAGMHVLRESSFSAAPRCGSEAEGSAGPPQSAAALLARSEYAADDASFSTPLTASATPTPVTIDLLVAYTHEADKGSTDILAEIDMAVAFTNRALNQSGVGARLSLVGVRRVYYPNDQPGSSMQDHIDRVSEPSDGALDEVQKWRNDLQADLLSLWVEHHDEACGRAWTPSPDAMLFGRPTWAGTSVVARSCESKESIFAHEIGHSLGALHNRGYTDQENRFPFGYGYLHAREGFGTLMTLGASRLVPFYSNPLLMLDGHRLGVPGTGDTASDVARLFRITAPWAKDLLGPRRPRYYCPQERVTRQEMATFLMRLRHGGGYEPPPATGIFRDVPARSTHAAFVEQLAREGITTGCTARDFCPTDPVTRAQMATFLVRYKHGKGFEASPAKGVFKDVPKSGAHAANVEQLARDGITTGCKPGHFCPQAAVTRAQMATFLRRIDQPQFERESAYGFFADMPYNAAHADNAEYLLEGAITTGCSK